MQTFRGHIDICLYLAFLVMCGCVQTGPQRPSQRKGEAPKTDSTTLALLELNKQLAVTADQQLEQIVQQMDESFALYEGNTWIAILDKGDIYGAQPKAKEQIGIHMRTYDLLGHLLEDSEGTYIVGKQELPPCVDQNISKLYHGCKAKLLAPWYQAYGLQGTANIPPYENVIIELELK